MATYCFVNYSNSVKNLHASVTKDLADLDHSPDLQFANVTCQGG